MTAAAGHSVATSSGIPSSAALPATSTTIITAEDMARAPASDVAGHPFARAGIQVDQSVWRRQRRPQRGGHARLRRRCAIQYAGAGQRTPDQRSRYRRVDFSLDSPQQHRPHRNHARQQWRRAVRRRSGRRRHQHRDQIGRRVETDGAVRGRLRLVSIHARANASFSGSYKGPRLRQFGNAFQFRRLSRQQFLPASSRRRRSSATPTNEGSAYFNFVGRQFASAACRARATCSTPFVGLNQRIVTDRRGATTPFNYANRQNMPQCAAV